MQFYYSGQRPAPHQDQKNSDRTASGLTTNLASSNPRTKRCVDPWFRRAPATRKAVLETISKCVEKSILRLPQFKKSLDDLRSRDYSKDGGARDDAILKSTISELHKLITEAPQFWSYELTIWAINTLANIGNILGPDRFTNHRLDSKNLDYPT